MIVGDSCRRHAALEQLLVVAYFPALLQKTVFLRHGNFNTKLGTPGKFVAKPSAAFTDQVLLGQLNNLGMVIGGKPLGHFFA